MSLYIISFILGVCCPHALRPSMLIMIVDDNVRVRRMIRRLLAGSDISFFECSDGSEVLPAYDKYHPDWILMDVVMKDMNGLAATQNVTRLHPEAKVVIVTQHDNPELRDKAIRAGAVGFVAKENLTELEGIIHAHRN